MPKNETDNTIAKYIRNSLIGALIAFLLCMIILVLGAICVSQGLVSEHSMAKYTLFTCALGCFIGGAIAVSKTKSKTLLIGILVAVIVFVAQLAIGYISYTEASIGEKGLWLLVTDLVGGILAGFFSGRTKKRKKH